MSKVPAYSEAPLKHLVTGLETHVQRPMRVQWETGPLGEHRAWLEVQMPDREYRRVASLTIREKGVTATYAVALVDDPGPVQNFAALATALRALRSAAVRTLKKARSLEVEPTVPHAPSLPNASRSRTYTAAEAIAHPAIRAAILAGRQIAEATGRRPEAGLLMAFINAALPAVALIEESYRPGRRKGDEDGAAWTERVLLGMLTGALRAAQDIPQETSSSA